MKIICALIVIVFFTLPDIVHAGDYYIEKANPKWKVVYSLDKKTKVYSKFKLNSAHKVLIQIVYNQVRNKFYEYMHINKEMCENGVLKIRVISEEDLDNRVYFLGEDTFAKGSDIIFGRYFGHSRVLYIVPPYESEYYWRSNMAHETLHHLYRDCGIKFNNIDMEHVHIQNFIKKHIRFFY